MFGHVVDEDGWTSEDFFEIREECEEVIVLHDVVLLGADSTHRGMDVVGHTSYDQGQLWVIELDV